MREMTATAHTTTAHTTHTIPNVKAATHTFHTHTSPHSISRTNQKCISGEIRAFVRRMFFWQHSHAQYRTHLDRQTQQTNDRWQWPRSTESPPHRWRTCSRAERVAAPETHRTAVCAVRVRDHGPASTWTLCARLIVPNRADGTVFWAVSIEFGHEH